MLKTLERYFAQREDIAFSFLFGSQSLGKASRLSDVDVAIYFFPSIRHPIEFEEKIYYTGEDQL